MEPHLSDLALDRLALGGATTAGGHLATCDACRGRLESFMGARLQLLSQPRYLELRDALTKLPPPRPRWPAIAFGVALAASMLVAVWGVTRRADDTRLKGGLGLQIALDSGTQPSAFRAGETVALHLSAAGHAYALVMGVDGQGNVQQLWPPRAAASGPAPHGDGARLDPSFRVTPGDMQLWSFFSDSPISSADAARAMVAAVDRTRTLGASALDAIPEPIPGEAGRAQARLRVEAGP
ncbi:MAG: hypothetical protein JST54_25870 [Deltaproteobacteria bacterium]|nr:hypothetical protein [Deltaproteobacteria bacterium]